MTKNSFLTRAGRALATNVALVVVGLACMQASHAGCGQYGPAKKLADSLSPSSLGAPRFIRAAYQLVDDESSEWRDHRQPAITGLWYFQYLSKGNKALGIPDGAILDQGNTIWFADGNEMTSPVTSNVWAEHSVWPQDPGFAHALGGHREVFAGERAVVESSARGQDRAEIFG